jgi:hypothetical protein
LYTCLSEAPRTVSFRFDRPSRCGSKTRKRRNRSRNTNGDRNGRKRRRRLPVDRSPSPSNDALSEGGGEDGGEDHGPDQGRKAELVGKDPENPKQLIVLLVMRGRVDHDTDPGSKSRDC